MLLMRGENDTFIRNKDDWWVASIAELTPAGLSATLWAFPQRKRHRAMRSAHALWGAIVLLVSACQSGPEPEYTGWIGRTPEGPDVALADYEPPREVGLFRFQGEMDFPDRSMRMFRYENRANADDKIDVALYPLPPGWSDMSGERAVAGHYGTVKQDMAERLTRRNDSSVEIMEEQILSLAGAKNPVAEGVFRETADNWTRTLVLQVAMRAPVFVRVTADYSQENGGSEDRLERIRTATQAFLEQGKVSPAEPAE